MKARLRHPLTIRATLALVAGVAGVYVVAVGAYIAFVLAPAARHLRSQAVTMQTEYAALSARAESLQTSLRVVHALAQDGERTGDDRRRAGAVRDALRAVTEHSEGVHAGLLLMGIPAAVRVSLADVAGAESRVAGVLLETLDYLDQPDLAAARERLASAEQPQRSLRRHLDELQQLGLADVVQSEGALDERAQRIAEAMAVWVILGAALVGLLLYLVHRRLYVPLRALDRGLAGVADGRLELQLPVRRDDELGRLTGHFNQMTDVLRARAEDERRRAVSLVDTQAATYRISEAAIRAPTLRDLFVAIHRIVGELMPARNFYIALWDRGTGTIAFPYFVDEFDAPPAPKQPGKGLTEYVLRTGEPLLATPDVALALERRGEIELIGAPSIDWLGVPLKPNGGTIGVLVVQTYTEGVRFTARERDILQFVSTQVAMTIERRRAEEAVRQSEEQYRALVDGVKDVIFALSVDGIITALNPAFEDITGWSRDEWLGRPFSGLLHPDEMPRAAAMLDRVVRESPRPTSQFRVRTRGGEYRLGEFHTSVQRRDGAVTGILGIVRDITDRVRLEEQLRHAQKMEAVGQVASGVAHDFNNLLTATLSSAGLLRAALPADSPLLDDVSTVADAARRGAELTGKLLAFSRRQSLAFKPVSLAAAAADFIRMAQRIVPESVRISLQVEASEATLQADAGALQQILLNLVTNARDAMPKGGTIRIDVGRRRLDAEQVRLHGWGTPGDYVTLSVADTGCGMDAATQARIFEPFFTTKPVGQGTGLGMPMVYGLVKDHGGFVQIYSESGHGTTVRLYFPAVRGEAVEPAPEVTPEVRGGTETLLLVEDADDVRRAATRVLEKHGYTVIALADGREALSVIRAGRSPADLIISDVVMPHAGGPDVLLALRRSGLDTKLLLTSGYTAREVRDLAQADPDVPFLAKPWSVEELLRSVRAALDERPPEGPRRRRASDLG